ncbi:hypothetical protein J2W30_004559 [Variovorax boronicumulans]|uniref:hypothetical protein n=1 Tax=Variovorax boronicumulans TaxID=436515 RepID=UPI00277E2FCD|nr:hypothetical protein [Variovorax boronicumulans]MDP9995673.1 hypothetical protein [Variovorax boronicumulans]MDQ0006862.1 hypothetical protein [Variovorax boronicumulans]MDQ0036784.1 hypothetical protein [Variovorax boronicumulans]
MRVATPKSAKKQADIPNLLAKVRALNMEFELVNSTPVGTAKLAIDRVAIRNELARLNAVVDKIFSSARSDKPKAGAAKPAQTPQALVLDTAEDLIKKGHLLDASTFQEAMGWKTRQAISKAVEDRRVFAIMHKSARYYPAFYADPRYDRTHLEAVAKQLADLPGGAKLQFFLTRKGSLGGKTPLEALAAGLFVKVKAVAAAFAEVPLQG